MHLASDPAIALLGLYPKDTASTIRKRVGINLFMAAVFAVANTGNNLNANSQTMVESTLVHPYTAKYSVTVKNNEDKFY